MTVTDRDLTFVMEAHRELQEVLWSFVNVRHHHPRSRLVLISDGSPEPETLAEIAGFVGAEFYRGRHLYGVENGGAYLHRRLEYCLRNPTRYIIKIDPDAKLARPFKSMPSNSCLFGSVIGDRRGRRTVQGGCYGVCAKIASSLFEELAFLDPALKDYEYTWGATPHIREIAASTGGISEDWIFGYVVQAHGHSIQPHAEFGSAWREPPPNPPPYTYAVTHPHKEEASGRGEEDLTTSTPESPFQDVSSESLRAPAPIRTVGPLLSVESFAHVFEPMRGTRWALADGWGNTGDQMIAAATRQLLDAFAVEWRPWVTSEIGDYDAILLPGGGSMGFHHWSCRKLRQNALLTGKPCVVLPQSYFAAEPGDFAGVFIRESSSERYCEGGVLAPDLALGYRCAAPIFDTKLPVGAFLRCDSEKAVKAPSVGDPARLAKSPAEYLMLASQYDHIITDRLHFAICSLMCGNRTTLLANSYHKNQAIWNDWLRALGCEFDPG